MTGLLNGKPSEVIGVDIPVDELDTPVGLYLLPSRKVGNFFDTYSCVQICNAKMRLMLRIDDGKTLPVGCEAAYFRTDGKRVVREWILESN